jgi:hypothetical protein
MSCCAPNGCIDHEEAWVDNRLAVGDPDGSAAHVSLDSVDSYNRFAPWTIPDVAALRRSLRK